MLRMTAWTALGLTLMYLTFGAMFADHTRVSWKECRLGERDIRLTFENTGGEAWNRFTIGGKVFLDGRLVASTSPVRGEELVPGASRSLRLGLPKALEGGKQYVVMIYIQRGRSPVVFSSWNRVPEVQMTCVSAFPDPFTGIIPPLQPKLGKHSKRETSHN
ncbi:MAG: hypothetical protein WA705_16545 [Candidatus Ozemobacteraceae bacterium]